MQFIQNHDPLHISVNFHIAPIDAKFHHELSCCFYDMLLDVNEAWANQLIVMRPRESTGELAITRISFVLGTYENYSAASFARIQQIIEQCCNSFADSKGGYDAIKPISS